jgi:cell wall-associated NlpC family hydrolase
MSDRRTTPANGRVAALHLQGQVQADTYVAGTPATVIAPVVDLCRAPDGPRERQVLLGTGVTVYEDREGWVFVQSAQDDYVGYVRTNDLGPATTPTHRVATLGTHAYAAEDIKSGDLMALPFGARVTVTAERAKFWETSQGYIPKKHLRPLNRPFTDPATVAQLHFGVPYLWGGNSTRGIDCSGLVQAALLGCDIACPGDSDMQRAALGVALDEDALLQRGDLIFWRGHVGMMVDADTMVHANAHHMAVAYESVTVAILRIITQGGGAITARKRLG